jgi:hypothetical protein
LKCLIILFDVPIFYEKEQNYNVVRVKILKNGLEPQNCNPICPNVKEPG